MCLHACAASSAALLNSCVDNGRGAAGLLKTPCDLYRYVVLCEESAG